jgi:hypothetical protein
MTKRKGKPRRPRKTRTPRTIDIRDITVWFDGEEYCGFIVRKRELDKLKEGK